MHIPDSMLQGTVCPVTSVAGAVGVGAAAYFASKAPERPAAGRFAAVTALIFALQMMNFPISAGTSGHLVGGVLAAALLGTPFGVLSMTLVVAVQCLLFSDGGLTVLGANVLNMAVIGAGVGGLLRSVLANRTDDRRMRHAATAAAAWASVVLASLAVSVQLAVDGQSAFLQVAPAMVLTHAVIGLGEAALTVACCALLAAAQERFKHAGPTAVPLTASVVVALLLSPFASALPDGLEWIAAKYRFLHEAPPVFGAPLPDYSVPGIAHEALTTGMAGLAGVAVTFLMAWVVLRTLTPSAVPNKG